MPRKHSSMGVLKPAMSTKLTNTQMLKNNLEQEEAVLRDVQEFIELNVNRQYIQEFQGDLQSQLTVQEFDAQNQLYLKNNVLHLYLFLKIAKCYINQNQIPYYV